MVAVTRGLGVEPPLLVVRVSSCAVMAWIWRWIAAGFKPVRVSPMIVLSWALTASRSARRCGVVAVSYFLVTLLRHVRGEESVGRKRLA